MEFCPDPSSIEFFGAFSIFPSSMGFQGTSNFPMEFHDIGVRIWLMIIYYFAKISRKRYILHWFQYRYSYFEHPSVSAKWHKVSENSMLFIYIYIYIYIYISIYIYIYIQKLFRSCMVFLAVPQPICSVWSWFVSDLGPPHTDRQHVAWSEGV